MKIKVSIKNQNHVLNQPTRLDELAKKYEEKEVLCALVNKRLRELSYEVKDDASIEFLGYEHADSIKIYETTLRYVIAMAVFRLFPKAKIKFNYSISRSILAIIDTFDKIFSQTELDLIEEEVKKIIAAAYPINRQTISLNEALQTYQNFNMDDKVSVLQYRDEDSVNYYACDGYINYMFGYMLPNTSYLKHFKLLPYYPGFLIQYPRSEFNGKIPTFVDEPIFGKALKDAYKWGQITKGNNIADINNYTKTRDLQVDFVNMCETKHNHQLYEIGDIISKNKEDIRLILIAGPSSSGKTTFSNRLRIELKSRNLKPVMISLDDYYLERASAPKDENGKPDLEHIESLDINQFNHDIVKIIAGEKVVLPTFNFKKGIREVGKTIQIDHETVLIIEGIHALNDRLTSLVPKYQKFKIYIAPQTQMHIDNHNPISITDLRLLRRIVRDQKYRGSSAEVTFSMWPSVRRGEFLWIYPFQNDADYVFNSELSYEFAVLKKHAEKELQLIDRNSEYFITANRLLKFLKYFRTIDEELVPCNSLLREFIGGSSFHEGDH